MPVAVIAALLAFYYSLIPDRKIAAHIDRDRVEAVYGKQMDAVSATLEVEDLELVGACLWLALSSVYETADRPIDSR